MSEVERRRLCGAPPRPWAFLPDDTEREEMEGERVDGQDPYPPTRSLLLWREG